MYLRLTHASESGAFFIFERFPFWKQFNNFNNYFTNSNELYTQLCTLPPARNAGR